MARLTKYALEEMGAKATYSSIATFVRLTWQRHNHKLGLGRRPPSPYPCPPPRSRFRVVAENMCASIPSSKPQSCRCLATNGLNRKSDG
jgi:hypothetical protein